MSIHDHLQTITLTHSCFQSIGQNAKSSGKIREKRAPAKERMVSLWCSGASASSGPRAAAAGWRATFGKTLIRGAVPPARHKGELGRDAVVVSAFGVFRCSAHTSVVFIEIATASDELEVLCKSDIIVAAGSVLLHWAGA